MQVRITGHNLEVTEAIRNYTEKKLKRIENHIDKITDVHVTFNVEKLSKIAEGKVVIPGTHIHARASSEDMYKSIDEMSDKLIRQLVKYKEKQTDRG